MNELDDLVERHRILRLAMPNAWNAFFARFGSLRPVQLAAMPEILSGQSVLVTAPTAGGKTEAIIAPICERLAKHRWAGLSVLLITPTRALVNDLFARLEAPLSAMQIGLGRKTSDHQQWDSPEVQLVVTTPESTESLLTFNRDALQNLQAVVVDEIHLLNGSSRGDQLRLLLQRLARFLEHRRGDRFSGVQLIAMSATVSDPERLAATYLGSHARVVSVPGQRTIDAKVIVADGDEKDRIDAALAAMDGFSDARKVLVFVNSRKLVDVSASHFKSGRFEKAQIYGHHGNLSKSSREAAEQRFKNDHCAICVATMTLEVGIDIGDVDLVVCLDPPFSLSSFLQRIGRGCRRLKGTTRVLCVARDRGNELIFKALIQQATRGMPPGPLAPFRRSVLFQQVLAYLRQVDKHRRTLSQFHRAFAASADRSLLPEAISHLVQEMTASGVLDRHNGVFRPATAGWDFIASNQIYSNIAPTPIESSIVDADTGRTIASVAKLDKENEGVKIAGKSYELLPGSTARRHLVRRSGEFESGPSYHTRTLPYSFDIGASLSNLLASEPGSVLCLRLGNTLSSFTWLGKLLNTALAEGLKNTGTEAVAGPFQLRLAVAETDQVIPAIRNAVAEVQGRNPFRSLDISRLVDLGPHFDLLSPELQKLAQEDWMPSYFLQDWSNALLRAIEVPLDSVLGQDLLSLA